MIATRSEYLKQLDDMDEAVAAFAEKACSDVAAATRALFGDAAAAKEVLSGVKAERRMRSAIEEGCLEIMLLQQPLVAGDLRFVTGTFRLVSDLTHIDEMTRDVAYLAASLPADVSARLERELKAASERVVAMVGLAVEAFRASDAERARAAISMDDEVDELYSAAEDVVVDMIKASETRAKYLPELLMVAKYFERMGDDAVRIADWAVFRATGEHETSVDSVIIPGDDELAGLEG